MAAHCSTTGLSAKGSAQPLNVSLQSTGRCRLNGHSSQVLNWAYPEPGRPSPPGCHQRFGATIAQVEGCEQAMEAEERAPAMPRGLRVAAKAQQFKG